MRAYFHGNRKKHSFFEGWYFKQQWDGHTLAVIPAFHVDDRGKASASIQVITEKESWWVTYPAEQFYADSSRLYVRVGESLFTEKGVKLRVYAEGLSLEGNLSFGQLIPAKKDLMGPFRWFPRMQCNHQAVSLFHSVRGRMTLNGTRLEFPLGKGYIEKDWGSSFPERYVWTQCSFPGKNLPGEQPMCVMASVADVPFLGRSFVGCICAILYRGKQYRMATYTGAKVLQNTGRELAIAQGKYLLRITVLADHLWPLLAPKKGRMTRTIYESAACRVRYELYRDRHRVFSVTSNYAGFEQEWEKEGQHPTPAPGGNL